MTTKPDPIRRALLPGFLLVLLAALLLGGCSAMPQNLPAVVADEIAYQRNDPLGGSVITAKNVNVDGEHVRAEEASWKTTYPAFSISLHVKGYKRKLTPAEQAAVPTVPPPAEDP